MSKFSLLNEFVLFLRENKKLWLLPIVITLLLLGALLVFAQGSALAPFIYTVFLVLQLAQEPKSGAVELVECPTPAAAPGFSARVSKTPAAHVLMEPLQRLER